MTCFWNGLIDAIGPDDIKHYLKLTSINPNSFVQALKESNAQTPNVEWNGEPLRECQLVENFTAVNELDVRTINSGYFCSTCDPFLFLISHIFNVNINHRYLNASIAYTVEDPRYTISCNSSRSHFTAIPRKR